MAWKDTGVQRPAWQQLKLAYVQMLTRQYEGAGMCPLADMLNTVAYEELTVNQELNKEGDFCLKSTRDLKAGEELLVNYGAESHSPMLMFIIYGFALAAEHHNLTVPTAEEYESSTYQLS